MRALRSLGVGMLLCVALLLPAIGWLWGGLSPGEVLSLASLGLGLCVEQVGWVLIPQLVVGVAVASLFVQRAALRGAGRSLSRAPGWLDAAIESALLLGMLGTITGMVSGFVDGSVDDLQAGPLVHSLGTALRSSAVGFGIALVGVWTRVGGVSPELAPR